MTSNTPECHLFSPSAGYCWPMLINVATTLYGYSMKTMVHKFFDLYVTSKTYRCWPIRAIPTIATFGISHFAVFIIIWAIPIIPFSGDKEQTEKVYFRSQILERPSIGKYWNISGVPVLTENVIFTFFYRAGVIQKLSILERKNRLVLSNTRVPVSGTWSILFPNKKLGMKMSYKNYIQQAWIFAYKYFQIYSISYIGVKCSKSSFGFDNRSLEEFT